MNEEAYQANKQKIRARQAVSRAVRNGVLQKEPCSYCGSEKVQAHHKDYSKPLEVKWLCSRCHAVHARSYK